MNRWSWYTPLIFWLGLADVAGRDLMSLVEEAQAARQDSVPEVGTVWAAPQGPWGRLEVCKLVLDPPEEFFDIRGGLQGYQQSSQWYFEGLTIDEVRKILLSARLDAKLVGELTASPLMEAGEGFVRIRPPDDLIDSMSRSARERIYYFLDRDPRDPFVRSFVIDWFGFERMVTDSVIPRETVDLISRLSYFHHGCRTFSDTAFVLRQIPDEEMKKRVLMALAREYALLVQLVVPRTGDMDSIVEYWTAGRRNRDILPFLESIRAEPQIEKIDIVHLLPPTPRKLLNSFGRPRLAMGSLNRDCFWTSFNFFNYHPSDRWLDLDSMKLVLGNYEKVTGELQFGDVIMIVDQKDKRFIHSCNFVAGNIVFTKNGGGIDRPWLLGTFTEVLSSYLAAENVGLSCYRRMR